jgi:protein-tyrosine phosphatase
MTSSGEPPVATGRRVPLDGALNFRDLGGYASPMGTTRPGVLYRSDALSSLTQRDVSALLDLGLATVVDLRRATEVDASPGIFAAHETVRYLHNPVAGLGDADLPLHERLLGTDFAAQTVAMARDSSNTFAFLFHLLAREDAYPQVFHCTGGADRTGVAAALILTAAGVAREEIMADYLISNDYLVPFKERMHASWVAHGIDPEPILAKLHLREAYLTPLLDMLEKDFGGVEGYLESIGVRTEELAMFRALFVVD